MTKYRLGTVVFCAVVISGCADRETELTVVSTLGKTNSKSIEDRQAACLSDSRVSLGLVSLDVCVGADLFFREAFGGNGRTCGTCHPAEHNFTIDPTFVASLPSTDPLFVAENSPDLTGLERPALMRQFGLILENVDGAEDPTNKFVMRSVPHTFALHTSVTAPGLPTPDGTTLPPLDRTGWSGDGAPGNGQLRDFQTGAVFQHYTKSLQRVSGVDFRPPTSAELDSILAFLGSVGRMNEIDLTGVSLTDSRAETGRITYIGARCNGCHRNAGANNGAGVNRNFDTGIEHARVAALDDPSGPKIPRDGGFGGQGLPAFNHDADGDGILDSYGNGTFNTPPLIEAADTGPFFHTNAFNTIEDAVTFYTTATFANSPAGEEMRFRSLQPTSLTSEGFSAFSTRR
jgi:cytochrome c peroxidase